MRGEGTGHDGASASPESASADEGVWRYARVERASVIVDADAYFGHMQQAMLEARERIFLIGWDFDTRIHLTRGRRWWQRPYRRECPSRLGSFVDWLVRHRPGLDVRILKWSVSYAQFLLRGSMTLDLVRWARHKRITFKFDSAHPIACSHHQKIAVLDDRLAVCGGIDMTDKRWDTRAHKERDERRRSVGGYRYGPWHDATMMMEGEAAAALAELGRDRWERSGGGDLPHIKPATRSLWPDALEPQFENVEIGIARTRAEYRGNAGVREVEALFLRHIREAKRFIYAESQYFASRAIAEAIARRLGGDDPPEIVIVHPANADGWLEQQAMDHARAALVRAIAAADRHDRFNLLIPYSNDTPIYVHAKLMIVDDAVLRIGSANMNNRSMGLDSECDVVIDSRRPGNGHAAEAIAALRCSLLAEHLGVREEEMPALIERHGTMRSLIETEGQPYGRHLRRYRAPDLPDSLLTLAESELLDPEKPQDIFEPFARGGLFRQGSRLAALRGRLHRRRKGAA
ncbi:phospholipase D-like domain-containing protein [Qipengyuania sediminis]|uniref:phospholipase D-like domain-containing protein n=1 Tax=Qipengyuania sediminis TaxID=1532023 RepID=UPI001F0DD71A|nr:phospholipase D-like domain-containing protein [Qipengyuania sediminis]